jgi:uncharacterized protein YaeQ
MERNDFDAWEKRIAARAEHLWIDAGRPDGPRDRFMEQARELVAIEENPDAGQIDAEKAAEPVIESLVAVENQGEVPGLTDQGDDQLFPEEQQSVEVPIVRK